MLRTLIVVAVLAGGACVTTPPIVAEAERRCPPENTTPKCDQIRQAVWEYRQAQIAEAWQQGAAAASRANRTPTRTTCKTAGYNRDQVVCETE